jgi:hypothetical protein
MLCAFGSVPRASRAQPEAVAGAADVIQACACALEREVVDAPFLGRVVQIPAQALEFQLPARRKPEFARGERLARGECIGNPSLHAVLHACERSKRAALRSLEPALRARASAPLPERARLVSVEVEALEPVVAHAVHGQAAKQPLAADGRLQLQAERTHAVGIRGAPLGAAQHVVVPVGGMRGGELERLARLALRTARGREGAGDDAGAQRIVHPDHVRA